MNIVCSLYTANLAMHLIFFRISSIFNQDLKDLWEYPSWLKQMACSASSQDQSENSTVAAQQEFGVISHFSFFLAFLFG